MAVMRKVKENIKKIIKDHREGKRPLLSPLRKGKTAAIFAKKSDISQHRRDPFQFKRTRWG